MKKSVLVLLAAVLLIGLNLIPKTSRASHAAGGELLYEWVSDSTYKIIFKFYRDCDGIGEPTTVSICYNNTCNSQGGSIILNKMTVLPGGGFNGQDVSTGCPGYPTTCNGGSSPGYKEWWYHGNVTLPSRCNYWRFFTAISSRNTAITNLAGGGANNLYVEATLNNLAAQGNSSPYFTVKPVPYVCVNEPYTYNNGGVDPNSDSLAFELIQPRTQDGACNNPPGAADIAFADPAFNLTNNPFATSNTFTTNSATGQMTFTPSATAYAVVTMLVREYRSGVLIGTVMRDIQIVVIPCNSTQPTVTPVANTITGAQLINGQIVGCATQPLTFCYDMKSSDTAAILVVSDNHNAAAPGSSVTYVGQQTDSVRGCFSWTPSPLDTGLRVYTVIVKDSTCEPPGIPITQTFVIPIYINPITEILKDTTICPGDSTRVKAYGGGAFVWSVLPGGSPLSSLSCTNCSDPWVKPTVTTRYVVQSDLTSMCNKNKDTVTITVVTPPTFSLGPDTTTCINNSLQLNVNLVPAPGTSYGIKWTPATYLDNDTIPNPITSPTDDITYVVTVTPTGIARCAAKDTINVKVLKGYTINNPDTAICKGAIVQVNATGDPRYTYAWTPITNVSNPSLLNPTLAPDTPTTYTLTATFPGCRDSVHTLTIDVQPVPDVYVGADRILCYGDTIHMQAMVSPPYNYTYNWTPAGALNDNTIPNPIYTALTTTTLNLTVSTPIGCSNSDAVTFEIIPADFMEASNDTALCPGDTAQLHVTGDAVSIWWRPNMWISDTLSTDPYVWPVTPTYYTVFGRDVNYCLDTQRVFVDVKPAALVGLPDSVRIYPGESYQMDPKGNCLYFQWFPPLGLSASNISNPIAAPEVNTRYFISAATEFGCTVQDSIDVFVSLESYIDLPNAFSPGSQPNSILKPVHSGVVTLKYFRVYNRWGTKVFESTDVNKGWDGTYNGEPQPMGVYIYMIEAETHRGRKFTKQGNITLLR